MRENGANGPSAAEVIALLGLAAHPEGGFYRETFRDGCCDAAGRAASSLIYFLLAAGEVSAWHRIDAVEVWHYYAGAPLRIDVRGDGHNTGDAQMSVRLGSDLASGERPQCVVPAGAWQTARSLGAWTLAGCAVAPAFDFAGPDRGPPPLSGTPPAAGENLSQSSAGISLTPR